MWVIENLQCLSPDDRFLKIVMIGMTENSRSRAGRNRWNSDVVDWCGYIFPEAVGLSANRRDWRDKIDDVTFSAALGEHEKKRRNNSRRKQE